MIPFDRGNDTEPAELRHLHIDEQKVRLQRGNEVQCLEPIFRLANQFQLRCLPHQRADPLADQRLIVDYDGAHGLGDTHAGCSPASSCQGMSIRTTAPAPESGAPSEMW